MIKNLALLICLTIFTTGCTYYRVHSVDTSEKIYYPKKSSEEVAFIEKITTPHEVIGSVTVASDRSGQRMFVIIERMKHEAAILGGDAITDIQVESDQIWKKIPPKKLFENAYIRANFTASVIAYK